MTLIFRSSILLLAAAAGCASDPASDAAQSSLATTAHFTASAIAGSGFQNTIARSPFVDSSGAYPMVVGADIAGLHRSIDGGASWRADMIGAGGATHVSSVVWSPARAGRLWVAADGGLFRSDDFGQTYALVSGEPSWNSNNPIQVDGNEHPRATGVMLAESADGADLWVATYSAGVWHSYDHGVSWDHKVLTGGSHIARGLAMDPARPGTVYVAMLAPTAPFDDGVYRIDRALAIPTVTKLGGPPRPEELLLLQHDLYVAAEKAGVEVYDGAWHSISNGDLAATDYWQALAGYVNAAGKPVLVTGSSNGAGGSVHIATDPKHGGAWKNLTTAPGAKLMYGGSTAWWAADLAYCHFDSSSFAVSQIVIDSVRPAHLWVAGRCGVWRSDDTGTTWAPAVDGLNVTVNRMVIADPNTPGRAYDANMDWSFFATDDHFETVTHTLPGAVAAGLLHNYGTAIAVDVDSGSPATVYAGMGNSRPGGVSDDSGEVYSNPDPLTAAWASEGLHPHTNGGLVFNVGVGHFNGVRVILATVEGSGLWRKHGATWAKVTGGPFASGASSTQSFSWVRGNTGIVYAHDGTGVWRSLDAGATWVHIVAGAGGVAWVDPTNHARLYYNDGTGTFRLDDARTAGPGARGTKISSLSSKLMAVSGSGKVYIAEAQFSGPGARLWRSSNPAAASPSFTEISDTYFRGAACNINWLAAGPDDYIYTSSSGGGVNVGAP